MADAVITIRVADNGTVVRLAQAIERLTEALNRTAPAFRRVTRMTERAGRSLDEVGQKMGRTMGATGAFSGTLGVLGLTLRTTGGALDNFAGRIQSLSFAFALAYFSGIKLVGALGAIVAGLGLSALGKAVSQYRSLEESLLRTALAADSSEQGIRTIQTRIDALLDRVARLNYELKIFTAAQIADAAQRLVKAGASIEEAFGETTKAVLRFSWAAQMPVAQATDQLVSASFQSGRAIKELADIIVRAAEISVADVSEVASVFFEGAKAAKDLGMSAEELAAFSAIMAQAGLRGSRAATAFRRMAAELSKIKQTGLDALSQRALAMVVRRGLVQAVEAFRRGKIDAVDLLKIIASSGAEVGDLALLFDIFGARAADALRGNIELFDQFVQEIRNAQGATERYVKAFEDTFQGKLDELRSAWDNFWTALTESPAAQGFISWLSSVLERLSQGIRALSGAIMGQPKPPMNEQQRAMILSIVRSIPAFVQELRAMPVSARIPFGMREQAQRLATAIRSVVDTTSLTPEAQRRLAALADSLEAVSQAFYPFPAVVRDLSRASEAAISSLDKARLPIEEEQRRREELTRALTQGAEWEFEASAKASGALDKVAESANKAADALNKVDVAGMIEELKQNLMGVFQSQRAAPKDLKSLLGEVFGNVRDSVAKLIFDVVQRALGGGDFGIIVGSLLSAAFVSVANVWIQAAVKVVDIILKGVQEALRRLDDRKKREAARASVPVGVFGRAVPQAQTGGFVKQGGLVEVHPAELIVPASLFKGLSAVARLFYRLLPLERVNNTLRLQASQGWGMLRPTVLPQQQSTMIREGVEDHLSESGTQLKVRLPGIVSLGEIRSRVGGQVVQPVFAPNVTVNVNTQGVSKEGGRRLGADIAAEIRRQLRLMLARDFATSLVRREGMEGLT